MRQILFLFVIATVALTACNNNNIKTTEDEKITITFGNNNYVGLNNSKNIFITDKANSDFVIEKAVDEETGQAISAENEGLNINTDWFSAKKIKGHNRLQININWNSEQRERNFTLYVKNGKERGKLTFNQKAYIPGLIGGEDPILFDPVYYCIDAKGGVIETVIAEDVITPFILCIHEKDGQEFYPPQYTRPVFFEATGLLSATVLSFYDEQDPDLVTGVKLKLDIKLNNTGKEREMYVELQNVTAMYGYVVVLQSAK